MCCRSIGGKTGQTCCEAASARLSHITVAALAPVKLFKTDLCPEQGFRAASDLISIHLNSLKCIFLPAVGSESLIYSIMVSTWMHRHWIPCKTDLPVVFNSSMSSGLLDRVNLNQANYETDLIRQTCYKEHWRVNRCECVIQLLHCCSCSSCGDIISLWPPFSCILLD